MAAAPRRDRTVVRIRYSDCPPSQRLVSHSVTRGRSTRTVTRVIHARLVPTQRYGLIWSMGRIGSVPGTVSAGMVSGDAIKSTPSASRIAAVR